MMSKVKYVIDENVEQDGSKPFRTFLGANQDVVLRSRRTSLTQLPIAVGGGGAP